MKNQLPKICCQFVHLSSEMRVLWQTIFILFIVDSVDSVLEDGSVFEFEIQNTSVQQILCKTIWCILQNLLPAP